MAVLAMYLYTLWTVNRTTAELEQELMAKQAAIDNQNAAFVASSGNQLPHALPMATLLPRPAGLMPA